MIRLLTLALLMLTSAAYAGQGMGPGPGARTYAVSGTTFGFESGMDGFAFTSEYNGGFGTDATSSRVSTTGHTGGTTMVVRSVAGVWSDDADIGSTAGILSKSITVPVGGGTVSVWMKGEFAAAEGEPNAAYGILKIDGATHGTVVANGWQKMTSDTLSVGTHTLEIWCSIVSDHYIDVDDVALSW